MRSERNWKTLVGWFVRLKLCAWQTVDHADVRPGVPGYDAVRLEGNEPALIPALGWDLYALQRVVRVIAVPKRVKVDRDERAGSHESLGEDGEGLADLLVEFVHVKPYTRVCSLDAAVGNVKIMNEFVRTYRSKCPSSFSTSG